MSEILPFNRGGGAMSFGGGPDDPTFGARIVRLEDYMREVKGSLKAIEISLAKIDGRLSGIDARFASLPTTWTMLTIIFTTWGIGSGILIFALNFFKR